MNSIRKLFAILGKNYTHTRTLASSTKIFNEVSIPKNEPNEIKQSRPFTVIIEGNIGSGKTTFLKQFEGQDVAILDEPVETWRDCNGVNLLSLMYKDPSKWVFTFQSYVQLTMLLLHLQKTQKPIKLMERSIFSARYCFVENLAKEKILTTPSFLVIDEWFKWITSHNDIIVDLIIYIRTTPEVAYERMKKRDRREEKLIPFEYLKKLHELHEEWLVKKKFHCPAPILTINGDVDLYDIGRQYQECRTFIFNSLQNKKYSF